MENCIFCRIIKGELPTTKLYEGEAVIAFRDINPQAPVHILIIPKEHYLSLNEIPLEKMPVVQELFAAAKFLAAKENIQERGYRLVINTRREGGQSVDHVHLHLLGGKQLGPSLVG